MPIDQTIRDLTTHPNFSSYDDEEQQRILALAISKDPDFARWGQGRQMQLLQKAAPNIDIMPLLTQPSGQPYNPGEQYGQGFESGVGALTQYGIPLAATMASGPLAAAAGAGARALPVISALTNTGANLAVGNTDVAKMTTLPNLLGALAQSRLGPGASFLKQGVVDAAGSSLGYLGNVAAGLEEYDPVQLGLTEALPLAAGGILGSLRRAARLATPYTPGYEIAAGEHALKESDAYWQGLRTGDHAEAAYKALAQQGENVTLPTPQSAALRKQLFEEQGLTQRHNPGTVTPVMAEASGRGEALRQLQKIDTEDIALPEAHLRLRRAALTRDNAQTAHTQALNSMDIDAIAQTREQLGIAEDAFGIAQRKLEKARNEITYAKDRYGEIFSPTLEQPFAVAHRQIKDLSQRIGAAVTRGGEDLGILKQQYRAMWEDLEAQSNLAPQLKLANDAFKKNLVAEKLGDLTTKSLRTTPDTGELIIDGAKLNTIVNQHIRDDELFTRAYTAQELHGIKDFYHKIAKLTARPNRIGLVVAASMLGGMAGQGIGIGWPAGSFIGINAPNFMTKIAASSPKVRRLMMIAVEQGHGKIAYQALAEIAQIAEQERARYGGKLPYETAFEPVDEEAR